jgi:hypothetical protein
MVQKFPTTTAYTPLGPDRANLVSTQKNFEDLFVRTKELETEVVTLQTKVATLETKVAAFETKVASFEAGLAALATKANSSSRTLGTAASVASGGSVHVVGSDATPFVTGPTTVGPSGGKYTVTEPDGTVRDARDGYDFYWREVRGTGQVSYEPVFYKDLEVVGVTRPPENRPGFVETHYDNGHTARVTVPIEEWNPPLAAWNKLPQDERMAVTREYAESRGYDVMLGGDSGDVNKPNTFESDAFRAYLESKGITGG